MKVLLVTPPVSNLNSPYPATAYLTAHLRHMGVAVVQEDWSLELALRLFTRDGIERLHRAVTSKRHGSKHDDIAEAFVRDYHQYATTVESVIAFLQGCAPDVADSILDGGFLPSGFGKDPDDLADAAAQMDAADRAAVLATDYLRDLCEVVGTVDRQFKLTSYGADISVAGRLSAILRFLKRHRTGLVSALLEEIVIARLAEAKPDLLGMTLPFPGNLIGAMRIAEISRRAYPEIKVVVGGGFVNTCLRDLTDRRFFEFVDYVTLDDGERPLECLVEHLTGERHVDGLYRTFALLDGKVRYVSHPNERDPPFNESVTPTYHGLDLDRYLRIVEEPSVTARVWGRHHNKLTLAHGCYWKKCSFCDTSLEYVCRYEPQFASKLVDDIEKLVAETGRSDFHWVDEAVPPKLMRSLCERLLERDVRIRWYGNLRFDKTFTEDLTGLMARAGCVMVTGGLEVASDRLLALMRKGISVSQVARVTKAFADSGIYVHTYLMYGFPSQTVQETVDSLELVRQLYAAGCIHSSYWHRFVVTAHSEIAHSPEDFGIRLKPSWSILKGRVFARFTIDFKDPTPVYHDFLGTGLTQARMAFDRGTGLDRPVHEWFPIQVPRATVTPDTIAEALESHH